MIIELGVYTSNDYKKAIVVLEQNDNKLVYYDILYYQPGIHSFKEIQKSPNKEMTVQSFLGSSDKNDKWKNIGKIMKQGSYFHIV